MMSKKILLLLIVMTPSILIGMEKKEEKKTDQPSPIKESEKKTTLKAPTHKRKQVILKQLTAEMLKLPTHETIFSGYLD